MDNSKQKKSIVWTIIVIICLIFIFIGFFSDSSSSASSSSSSSKGEVRCWYCSKVIYNNGNPIHCKNEYLNTYTCDYCGTKNVIK